MGQTVSANKMPVRVQATKHERRVKLLEERLHTPREALDHAPVSSGEHASMMGQLAGMLLYTADASCKNEQAAKVYPKDPFLVIIFYVLHRTVRLDILSGTTSVLYSRSSVRQMVRLAHFSS